MHIHIIGICGTFMGGVAQLARAAGHQVSGSDQNVYPPMDAQLISAGITLIEGYSEANLKTRPDLVVIGNAMSRGNQEVEYVLNNRIPYTSGAQWLCDEYLKDKWVLAVAGTHGKTTTSSMLAWILEYAGLAPGFLIGGVPSNFNQSARVGDTPFFVVEADEYDTAFFDKRSKFVHYRPNTLVLNNLEFDHADIFEDIGAIKKQFHHLVRTVAGNGLIVVNTDDQNLIDVQQMGCWSGTETFAATAAADWRYSDNPGNSPVNDSTNNTGATLKAPDDQVYSLPDNIIGLHNMANATAAIAAARHAGVPVEHSLAALAQFEGVKRRLEMIGDIGGVRIYDDFAHHPTAVAATLIALRGRLPADGQGRLIACLDFGSNTMRSGTHLDGLPAALNHADISLLHHIDPVALNLSDVAADLPDGRVFSDVSAIVSTLREICEAGDTVVCMSNGSFGAIHGQILTMLSTRSS